jgi:hypothetical protein
MLLFDALDPKPWAHKLRQKWPFYAAAGVAGAGFLIVRHAVLQMRAWPIAPKFDNHIFAADFWTGRLTAIKVLGLDLWLMIFPWNLSSDRSYNQIPLSSPTDPWVWVAGASFLLILGLAIAARRRMPLLFWSAGFAAITLLPTANLLIPIGSIMGERFLYLPAFAFTVAVIALAFRLIPAHLVVRVVAVLVVLLGARTFARNFDWQDNLSLMKHDAESAPASFKTHDLLARSLCNVDDRANIDWCIQESEIAVRILEGLPPEQQFDQTLTHLGLYYSLKGDQLGGPGSAAATPWYEKALAMLLRARAVSALSEKAFLRDQEIHGRPFRMRIAFQPIYRDLATVYRRLGRKRGGSRGIPSRPGGQTRSGRVLSGAGRHVSVDESARQSGGHLAGTDVDGRGEPSGDRQSDGDLCQGSRRRVRNGQSRRVQSLEPGLPCAPGGDLRGGSEPAEYLSGRVAAREGGRSRGPRLPGVPLRPLTASSLWYETPSRTRRAGVSTPS